jgi:two-component system alkaline phosphatase synthesis response regulator PhoP
MDRGKRILVVDDDPDICELLRYNLEIEGYKVLTVTQSTKAVEIALSFRPNLIILDVMMPEQDGVETCRQIRKTPTLENVFVMFLSARTEEYTEVAAFEMGGDDYITKPIRPRALKSRIDAVMNKKVKGHVKKLVKTQDLEIDRSSYTVKHQEEKISFPKKEFELLYYLASNSNVIHSRHSLLNEIWGNDVEVLSRTVDVHIRKIREKIGTNYIQTIKGVGYKFVNGK